MRSLYSIDGTPEEMKRSENRKLLIGMYSKMMIGSPSLQPIQRLPGLGVVFVVGGDLSVPAGTGCGLLGGGEEPQRIGIRSKRSADKVR